LAFAFTKNWKPGRVCKLKPEADGGEGGSITVTTTNTVKSAHLSYRITGHELPSTQAPEASTGWNSESDANPDPDSLTPTGGAKDYLWFAISAADDGRNYTGYPSSYANGEYVKSSGPGSCSIASARRNLNASSENPGVFTIEAADQVVAGTIAIHPLTLVGVGPVIPMYDADMFEQGGVL